MTSERRGQGGPVLSIAIAGAGLLGRLLAWRLSRAGHRVDVFDPAPDGQPCHDGRVFRSQSLKGTPAIAGVPFLHLAWPVLARRGTLWR